MTIHESVHKHTRAARGTGCRRLLRIAAASTLALPLLSGRQVSGSGPCARPAVESQDPRSPARVAVGGALQAQHQDVLRAPLAGVLVEVRARPGDAVEPGQLLARLDPRALRSALRTLLAAQSAAGTPARSESNTELQRAIAAARAQLARSEVRAAARAVITSSFARPGARVEAGSPLFRIVSPDALELQAVVTRSELHAVRRGQRAALRIQGFGARLFAGTVEHTGWRPGLAPGTLRVTLRLDPSAAALRPGLLARGELSTGTQSDRAQRSGPSTQRCLIASR